MSQTQTQVFPAQSGSHEFFIAWVPSTNVKAGSTLAYTRKDGQVLTGTCRATLGSRIVGGVQGTDVCFAKPQTTKAKTKADLEAELAALKAQLGVA